MSPVEQHDHRLQRLVGAFQTRCGPVNTSEIWVARAPGRVNLIGEHTDYNDGFVLPIAIDRDVLMVGALRSDSRVKVFSLDYEQTNEFSLNDITRDDAMRWSNYIRGVLDVLQKEGYALAGMDIALTGNVPQGSGLSSSAALEVATASLVSALCDLDISPVSMARLAQRAENEFVGVQCGIMDQFISRLGQEDHALLIDCRSYEYRHIPWSATTVRVLVADTRVERGLVDSEYNKRRQECEAGVEGLSQHLPGITALRDVSVEQFQEYSSVLDPVVRARCEHVVYENERVLAAVDALESADWPRLGALMNASHESLRDLFEVSCLELNRMVEIARDVPGVYGARMTGGGFGGCAIALVDEDAQEELQEALWRRYPEMTGRQPQLLPTGAADGARVWRLGQERRE